MKAPTLTRKAMTMVEILLVISLMSVTALALYSAMATGMTIWDRAARSSGEEDAAIFLDRIGGEMRGALRFSLIAFEGSEDRLSFASPVRVLTDASAGGPAKIVPQIGRVEYVFDRDKHVLFRRQAEYGQALQGQMGPPRVVMDGVTSFQAVYFLRRREGVEKARSVEKDIPAAVLLEIRFKDKDGEEHALTRLFNLPLGAS
ncbi:MAG: hypothetical protein Q8Q08_11395 [Candidatus Omnitrophota bacterium]|nr:hypothetical protein [Candidatus Omnitrophota bacterium]MDZ4243322.1 hypothetical protein [Candidatus Omnitrophota bacterium]